MPDLNFFKIARRTLGRCCHSRTRFWAFVCIWANWGLVTVNGVFFTVVLSFFFKSLNRLSVVVSRDDDNVIGRDYDQSAGCSHHLGIDSTLFRSAKHMMHFCVVGNSPKSALYHLSRNRSLVHSSIDVMGKVALVSAVIIG